MPEAVRHYRHSFNEIRVVTYTRPTQQCHFEWPWVFLSDLTKYSVTQSARGLSATAELLVLASSSTIGLQRGVNIYLQCALLYAGQTSVLVWPSVLTFFLGGGQMAPKGKFSKIPIRFEGTWIYLLWLNLVKINHWKVDDISVNQSEQD